MFVPLTELEREGKTATFDADVADALRASGLVTVAPEATGRWRLIPKGRSVGAVSAGNIDVYVRPKLTIGRLLFLLGYAKRPGFLLDDAASVEAPGLWPALAESLAGHTERALARGVLQGYQTVDDTLPLIRGRLRVTDQLARRPGMLLPIEVSYDEFTADTPENQLLRAAVRRMLAVPRLHPAHRVRLTHLDAQLSGVRLLPDDQPPPQWTITAANTRYATALRLADIVLRNLSVEPGPGDVPMAGFVVNMDRVFEDFVTTALAEALSARGDSKPQYPLTLDLPAPDASDGAIQMKVDLVHLVNGQPRLAFDAKYKVEGVADNPNRFQMLAYCTALGITAGWLVYAEGDGTAAERRVRNSDICLIEYPLDLTTDPADLLAQIRRLADLAWNRTALPAT
jgi:5-methylcytosine-specific restriction enzyme subunit McrC